MPKYDSRGFISALDKNEVFVFGSNGDGMHGAGAAKTALEKFGAKWGQGEGLQGQSYAIDTMSGEVEMYLQIDRFKRFAFNHPELTFYVTEIGCGIAGYTPEQVGLAFVESPRNIVLPDSFKMVADEALASRREQKNIF